MNKLSKKGLITISIIAVILLVLLVVGVFTLPIYGTIEAIFLFVGGLFFGFLLGASHPIKDLPNVD